MLNPLDRFSGGTLLFFLTFCNACSMGWFGYDQGVFSGVIIAEDFIEHFPETKRANVNGITSSCFSLGAFIGCLVAFTYGDKVGRKKTITFGQICNIIGAILQVAAFHLPMLIVGRIINGFGMGMTSSTCPVYQAECTKARMRGKLVVIGSLTNTFCYMLASWMNYALYFSSGPYQWRFPLAFQLIFPLFVIPIIVFLPESPRWLILQDRSDEALLVISRLWGKNLSIDDEEVRAEHASIIKTLEEERAAYVPVKQVLTFRDPGQNFRRLLLSMGTQLMQQFTGVNALGYYLPTILKDYIGFSGTISRLLVACNATSYLGAAFLCLILIDLVGRRRLMLWGSISAGTAYLIASICLKVSETKQKREMGIVTTSMFFFYYVCYGTSYAKVPWVYNSEVNSLGWRTRGAALATATNWMGGFIVTQFTKTGVNNLHWKFYLMFAIFVYSYFPIVYLLYPETCSRTLEDIDLIFTEYKGVIVVGPGKKELTQRSRPQYFIEKEKERVREGEKLVRDMHDAIPKTSSNHIEVEGKA
ncbi:general substrate transporter [Dipodascopsis uninucleata]